MHDLSKHNTLALKVVADKVECFTSETALQALLATGAAADSLILGGGSNCVLPPVIHQPVLIPALRGIRVLQETTDQVLIEVAAGENWNDLVWYTLQQHWYGLENLVAIPGWAGAAPVQNIGAYGVEIKECLHSVRLLSLKNGSSEERLAEDCGLAYRDSVFKNQERDNWLIVAIRLWLRRTPLLRLDYGEIRQQLQMMHCTDPGPLEVAQAIQTIRQRKLPDPEQLPNVGSFFKNPWLDKEQVDQLLQQFPDLPHYPQEGRIKLPAAWLIERCGLKGQQNNGVGCAAQHALVVVNYKAQQNTQREVLDWVQQVQTAVQQRFGVWLDVEPRVYVPTA